MRLSELEETIYKSNTDLTDTIYNNDELMYIVMDINFSLNFTWSISTQEHMKNIYYGIE